MKKERLVDKELFQEIGASLGIPFSVLLVIILSTVKWWFPKLINFFSEKGLIKFRIKLETEKEKQLAKFGKSITGFNKYFNKKYDIYPKLYLELILIQGELKKWEDNPPVPNFEKLTEDDIHQYLELFKFSILDKRDLVSKWKDKDLNYIDLMKLLHSHLKIMVLDANNYFQENRMFLSSEVESKVISIFVKFQEALVVYYYTYAAHKKKPDIIFELKEILDNSNSLIMQLLKLMKSELEHKESEKTISQNS